MSRRADSTQETRERIHEAAIRLFSRKGFHGTSVRDIATGAGVSVGNLYNHHPNKEALFGAIMADFERAYTAEGTPIAAAFDAFRSFDDLEGIGRASREMVKGFADYIRLIYVDVVELGGEHIQKLFGGMHGRYRERFGERLERLVGDDRVVEGETPLTALMLATIAFFYLFNVEHLFGVPRLLGMDDEAAIKAVSRIIRQGVRP